MFSLKVLFGDESHLCANCLFSIPTIYPKCHCFRLFSRGIRMWIPILRGVQNGHINGLKDSVLWLNFFFKLSFYDGGHLYPSFLPCIPTIWRKCYLFHFFSRGICMYISILTGVRNGHINGLKGSVFWLKIILFEASFLWWRSFVCQLLALYSDYLS